jgi:adenosine deaminase
MADAPLSRTDFVSLPKAELHLHTEAAMRPETVQELSDRYGLPMPPLRPDYPTWPDFSRAYESCRNLVGSLDDVRRVVGEIFASAPDQGIVWTELHLVPHLYRGRLGPVEGLVEAALDGLAGARRAGRGDGALVLGVGRDCGPAAAAHIARLAVRHRERGVAAVGLTGDEHGFPADDFAPAFRLARDAGLALVPHAGESGPRPACGTPCAASTRTASATESAPPKTRRSSGNWPGAGSAWTSRSPATSSSRPSSRPPPTPWPT